MSPPTTRPPIARIARLALSVGDVAAMRAFYVEALGFAAGPAQADGSVVLDLGGREVALVPAPAGARPYPEPRAANDPWFQHFAIAVADMDAACDRLARSGAEPISRGGPQRLPASSGGVTAYKFRDPEGRPLELSHAPGGPWAAAAQARRQALFLGIDHTALAVSDLHASLAAYTGLGFAEAARSLNQGPEQARLDGLDGALLDIVVLATPQPGPHVELLHYRSPAPARPRAIAEGDLAATCTVLSPSRAGGGAPQALTDPDGHRILIAA